MYVTVQSLLGETVADCSGLEWLLLSMDRLTGDTSGLINTNATAVCTSKHVLSFLVHVMLSSSLQSWEGGAHNHAQQGLGVVLNPSSSERFVTVSIMENIVRYRIDSASHSELLCEIRDVSGSYSTGQRTGFAALLHSVLETMEDALLMKDKYGVVASAYLVAQLFGHDNSIALDIASVKESSGASTCSFLAAHMATIFPTLRNVMELLDSHDTYEWLLSSVDKQTDTIILYSFLELVHLSLFRVVERAENTSLPSANSVMLLKNITNNLLLKLS